jgi:hypothetical protein
MFHSEPIKLIDARKEEILLKTSLPQILTTDNKLVLRIPLPRHRVHCMIKQCVICASTRVEVVLIIGDR